MHIVSVCDGVGASKPLPIATLRHCMPMVNLLLSLIDWQLASNHKCTWVFCHTVCYRSVFLVWSSSHLSPLNCALVKDLCSSLLSILHVRVCIRILVFYFLYFPGLGRTHSFAHWQKNAGCWMEILIGMTKIARNCNS